MLKLDVYVSISPPTGRGGHRNGRKICLAKEKMEPSMLFRTFGADTDLLCSEDMQKRGVPSSIRKRGLREVHSQVKG